jgi:hypothetical protein
VVTQNARASQHKDIDANNAKNMHYEIIRRTLTHRAGGAPDSNAVADAALSTWHQMAARLAPLIGARGFDALFNRSVHVTGETFPWLALVEMEEHGAAQLASLGIHLADRDPDVAAEASYVLLVTFTVLLETLIGESLTKHLLEPVWTPLSANSEEESKS